MTNKLLEPSLLSIDKTKHLEQLKQIKSLGIDVVHYDVMDGKFTPNHYAFKTEYLQDILDCGLKANVHLMVVDPENWIPKYKEFKPNSITFHAETQDTKKASELLDLIHSYGVKAGIAVNPETDLEIYKDLFYKCDLILCMSVTPGLGGQKFNPEVKKNLVAANKAKEINPDLAVQIDGGINNDLIGDLLDFVDWFVTGNWFFHNMDKAEQLVQTLKNIQ